MQLDPEFPPLEYASESRLPFRGGFSGPSLLASVLLHGLVLASLLVWKGWEHRPADLFYMLDLQQVSLGGRPAPAVPATAPEPTREPSEQTPAAPAAESPTVLPADSSARVEASAPEKPEEKAEAAPAPEPTELEARASAQEVGSPSPPVPQASKTPEALSPEQMAYYRAVWTRVREVAMPWSVQSEEALFQGWISFHLCIDEYGRLRHDPVLLQNEPGREHARVVPLPKARGLVPPAQLEPFLWERYHVLVESIRLALKQAQPFPRAPEGMIIPENMAFPVDLNRYEAEVARQGPSG